MLAGGEYWPSRIEWFARRSYGEATEYAATRRAIITGRVTFSRSASPKLERGISRREPQEPPSLGLTWPAAVRDNSRVSISRQGKRRPPEEWGRGERGAQKEPQGPD